MHSERLHVPGKPFLPLGCQVGYFGQNDPPMASLFSGFAPPLAPLCNVDIKPFDTCPRNFFILDQTNHRSQVMFHPEMNPDFIYPGFGIDASFFQSNVHQEQGDDNERKTASLFKEDTADINALLSTEYEDGESDDDLRSTARTDAMYECNSPESYSNYESQPKRRRSCASYDNDKRRYKMKKMVKALKRVVPGTNRMSTVAVLDEAVRYLKSLRVEVQKLGIGNSKV